MVNKKITQTSGPLVTLVILAATLLLLNLPPVHKTVTYLLKPLLHLTRVHTLPEDYNTANIEQLRSENEFLKKQIAEINTELSSTPQDLETTLSSVISRSTNPYVQELMIGIGEESEVEAGDAVLHQGFLVGQIIEVGEGRSRVRLINDTSFRAIAKTPDGAHGLLNGKYNSVVIDRIPRTERLEANDLIRISELDENLPPNLPIGRIVKIFEEEQLVKHAQLALPSSLDQLSLVSVVISDD